jgi:cytochrome c oxidase subunit 1
MLVVTLPWHLVGIMGQPRRMAYYDFTDPALAPQAIWVSVSAVGGLILLLSAMLLVCLLVVSQQGQVGAVAPLKLSLAVHPPHRLPASLNGFRVWIWLILGLTIANYGYPIAQSVMLRGAGVPPYLVDAR